MLAIVNLKWWPLPQRICISFCLTLNFLLLPCSFAAAKDFADWTVGCDNLRGCTALGFPAAGQEANGFIQIERAGDVQRAVEISVTVFADGAIGTIPLSLTIDGNVVEGVASARSGQSGQTGREGFTTRISLGEMEPFITALRKGKTLRLVAAGVKAQVDISLHGAFASLLNIDDIQHRVGTNTALVSKGGNSRAIALPTVPAIVSAKVPPGIEANKNLAPELRRHVKAYLEEHCDLQDSGLEDQVITLDASRSLVGLICSTGAYNITTAFWIITQTDFDNAALVEFEGPGPTTDNPMIGNRLVNAEFDRQAGTVAFLRKDRGLGDCGATGKYLWTGSKFALLTYAALDRCRGVTSRDWPILWRAKAQ